MQWVRHSLRQIDPPQLLSLVMVGAAGLSFAVVGQPVGIWRYAGALAVLAVLFALNMLPLQDVPVLEKHSPLAVWFLLGELLLFLLAIALSEPHSSFIPFLLFMLIGQAIWSLRLPAALAYAVLALGCFIGLVLANSGQAAAMLVLGSMSTGVLFTVVFSLLTVRANEQTARTELLLAQLRTANTELAAARERERELAVAEERVRLARDIHDGLGHHLTVLNVQLQAAARLVERDPARAAMAIALCREEAQAAMADVRQSVAALRRTPLDGATLETALDDLIASFKRHASLTATCTYTGPTIQLPPAGALTIYRAVQEGLTNAQKHAAARTVAVLLANEGTSIRLRISDDGTGAAPPTGGGFGLLGLRERAEHLGGTTHTEATPHGFILELTIPAPTGHAHDSLAAG